jgi:endo-1,4-beta-D-glucanase Y
MLALSLTAEHTITPESASKIVVADSRAGTRTYQGLFPVHDGSALLLQVPDLPASTSPVKFSIQAYDDSGCPVTDAATVWATIKAGVSTDPINVDLSKASTACGDGGVLGDSIDSGIVDALADGSLDVGVDAALDAAFVDAGRDVASIEAVGSPDVTDIASVLDALVADTSLADAPLVLDSAVDVPLGSGGVSGFDSAGTGGSIGSGGSGSGGATGTGGISSTGGNTGSGGTASTGGMSSTGGNYGTGGMTSTGGSGAGGVVSGGTSGTGGSITAAGNIISDFETTAGKADLNKSGGRTGYWYVYFPSSDTSSTPPSGTTMSPALSNGSAVATEASDSGYALHIKGSGFTGTNNYAGTGANFTPHIPYDKASDAYDVSAYTGISLKIKSVGTAPATYFELLTKENQPTSVGGTATDTNIELYNTRGQLLNDPWTPGGITSSYTTVTIPFGTLVPRWVPDTTDCNKTSTTAMCKAPIFNPKDVLGFSISFYSDSTNGFPQVGTPGTFELWIDDVQFMKDDAGLQTRTGFPLTDPGRMGSCISPTGPSVGAKYLVSAYNQWKSTFVKGGKVVRPENANDTVSEGIAYGMLIAVNMNDKTTFDSLYSTWTSNKVGSTLMQWCLSAAGGGTGSGCSTGSTGSATDADEDTAFALLQAAKVFGDSSYKTKAMAMISEIWSKDIDSATKLPKGGSNYASPTGTSGTGITNASYFAPAYYTAFKAAGDSNDWDSVNSAVYSAIGKIAGSTGLIPAWCGNSCTAAASNGASTDVDYQYDSHRIPMRIGLDYCFNGTAAAKAYTDLTTSFFSTNASAGKNGVGRILDMYTPAGGNVTNSAPNSASILGTAAVGAMASGNQSFLNDAYQAVFDAVTRGTMAPVDSSSKTTYSFNNATVGILTLLIMNGNFSH